MIQTLKYPFLFMFGGDLYCTLEIYSRGYTHWTMYLLGGLCFILLGIFKKMLPETAPIIIQMLIGGVIITMLELITGLIVNIGFGWHVWDYSKRVFNFMGQICLKNTLMWCGLSFPGMVMNDYLKYWLFDEERPHYRLVLFNFLTTQNKKGW